MKTLWIAAIFSIGLQLLAQDHPSFTGTWLRNAAAGKGNRKQELTVEQSGNTLSIKTTNTSQGVARNLVVKYEIGGREVVFKGLDGDKRRAKAHWDGASLIFDIVEHEDGKDIPSRQIWTLSDGGSMLHQVQEITESGQATRTETLFTKQ